MISASTIPWADMLKINRFVVFIHQQSKLNNIFDAGFLKTKDRSSFGNNFSIKPFINRIKRLESQGMEINVDNKTYHIYFVLAFVL